jgi:hypothetical protein
MSSGRTTVRVGSWLALIMLAALGVFAATLNDAVRAVQESVYDYRWDQTRITVDLLCDHIDDYVTQDEDWDSYDYAADFGRSFSRLDSWTGVFAAIYGIDGEPLSERVSGSGESLVTPWDSAEFVEAVRVYDRGEVTIPATLLDGSADTMRVYYRWVPTGQYPDKLLAAAGVTRDAMQRHPAESLVSWCVALLAAATLKTATSLIALLHHRHKGGAPDAEC